MYVIIENWIIKSYSKTEIENSIYTKTQWLCAWMIIDKIIWDEIIAYHNETFIKDNLIKQFKEIEKQATSKRAEYLTAEMLPEWTFKELKLAKLKAEWDEIKSNYEKAMNELVSKYWDWIIKELL